MNKRGGSREGAGRPRLGSENLVPVSLKLPESLKNDIFDVSVLVDKSESDIIREAITEYIEKEKKRLKLP